MENCNGFGNTGWYFKCDSLFKALRGMFVVPTFDGDGAENKVAAGTEIDDDYLTDRINDTDALKRWYPIMGLEAASSERAEPTYFENPSGAKEFVKQGARDISFEVRKRGPEFLGQIEACSCDEFSFFAVDADGKLRGKIKSEDVGKNADFYPVRMEPASFYATLVQATEDNPEHLMVQFQYGLIEKDSLLRTYPDNLVTAELLAAKGLIDVYSTTSGISQTGFTIDMRTIFTVGEKFRPEGLLAADFTLYNETDDASVTITSVTETSPGVYVFVIPSQTVADVLTLTPSKDGFDFTRVVESTITIA